MDKADKRDFDSHYEYWDKVTHAECAHAHTVCINEEGNAGVYCVSCGEKICDDC